jgi:hypothetical protein
VLQTVGRIATRTLAGAVISATAVALIATSPAGASPTGARTPAVRSGSAHIAGVVPVKGGAHRFSTTATNLSYHGGRVMRKGNIAYLIFWEPTHLQTGAPTHVSATYHSLLQRYFTDFGGSGLNNVATQYYETINGINKDIQAIGSVGGTYIDTSNYPASGCVDSATPGNCLTDAQIQAEVRKAKKANGWTPGYTHQFFVFTSYGEGSCYGSNSCAFVQYCAYHGWFGNSSKPTIYANQPYTGTDLNGCGTSTSPNNDIDADSTINVSSHEQREATNDPQLNAWWNSSTGQEGSDQCAWMFGSVNKNGNTANVQWNGHYYIVQQEWSNSGSHCVLTYP